MDKPRFTVIENGEQKNVDRPKTEDELWQDECHEDVVISLRQLLKDTKEKNGGRIVGMTMVFVYDDGSVGHKHTKVSGFPALLGAMELAKHSRITAKPDTVFDTPTPVGEDDE